MDVKEIVSFVKLNVEPINYFGRADLYRCSAVLNDGTYLPCVAIQWAQHRVDLAIKRFEETRNDNSLHKSMGYGSIVRSFVCRGNVVNDFDIKELNICPYAIPKDRLKEIGGETSMGWTEFIGKMFDGKEFTFATTFETMFFNMPEGYSADKIIKIFPAIRGARPHNDIYREKPFFNCYLDASIK